MMSAFLFHLTSNLPCRIISDGSGPYLERYYLFNFFGVQFYIHRFVASDPDRGFHDHPWKWAGSIVLSGSYTEHSPNGQKRIRFTNAISGYDFHRVVLDLDANGSPAECWTLFFHDDYYSKKWGFLTPLENRPREMRWRPWNFDPHDPTKDGSASSGRWWLNAPSGAFCEGRQAKK
jgi:hypothetical protein